MIEALIGSAATIIVLSLGIGIGFKLGNSDLNVREDVKSLKRKYNAKKEILEPKVSPQEKRLAEILTSEPKVEPEYGESRDGLSDVW